MALNVDKPEKESDKVKSLQAKVRAADNRYAAWADEYNVERLEGYYSGVEQKVPNEPDAYVINMCQPSIEQRLPALMFHRPKFSVTPDSGKSDDIGQGLDPVSNLEERCAIREDILHQETRRKSVGFKPATKTSLRESHYAFGITEVGFDADPAENPNAGQPLLGKDGQPITDSKGEVVKQGEFITKKEFLWTRRIPASNFRVSAIAHNELEKCEWVGYFEWIPLVDLKKSLKYQNLNKLKDPSARVRRQYDDTPTDTSDPEKARQSSGMVKVWKLWDNRSKTKFVWVDQKNFLLLEEPFRFLPFADLKFYDLMDEFYPVPVMYSWTPVQDELNEARNALKLHRRRFVRRYKYIEGKVSNESLEKLKSGPDGVAIPVPQMDVLEAIEDAPLDRAVNATIPVTREDFVYVSAVPSEATGVAEADTATQATIISTNQQIRESEAREIVADWLARIGWLMLQTIEEYFTLDMVVLRQVDPLSPAAVMEAARIQQNWQLIKMEQLAGLEYSVSVDVEELSPVTEDLRRNQWTNVLLLLTNPQVTPLLMASPAMLRRTLKLYGIRSEREIKEIEQALQIVMLMMAAQAEAQAKPKPGEGSGQGSPKEEPAAGPGPTPSTEDTGSQLNAQVG